MYAKIDSWHKVEEDGARTRCGLDVEEGAPTSDTLPLDEKSCETCLRLALHDSENPDADSGQHPTDPEDLE